MFPPLQGVLHLQIFPYNLRHAGVFIRLHRATGMSATTAKNKKLDCIGTLISGR